MSSSTETKEINIPIERLKVPLLTANDAVFSDVHSNLEALVEVLRHMMDMKVKRVVSLGDNIGYGPDPKPCLDIIRYIRGDIEQLPRYLRRILPSDFPDFVRNLDDVIVLKGNHEEGVISTPYGFTQVACEAIEWTAKQFEQSKLRMLLQWAYQRSGRTQEHLEMLRSLDYNLVREGGKVEYAHACPGTQDENLFQYLNRNVVSFDDEDIVGEMSEQLINAFEAIKFLCFVGHTHIPMIFEKVDGVGAVVYQDGDLSEPFSLLNRDKLIVNVGSVGQPRDEDNRACYATLINGVIQIHRVPYDHKKTAAKIRRKRGLPDILANRLLEGI